jgi:hypothetical protein
MIKNKQDNKCDELTVCFWNILFDALKPSLVKAQHQRISDISKVLNKLPEKTLIGLAEVEGDNGKLLAQALGGHRDFWTEHHRPNDHIGVLSGLDYSAEAISIGERCNAVVARHQNITVVVVHLPFSVTNEARRHEQVETLLDMLDLEQPTIIMGDFNNELWQKSRRLLRSKGFKSAINNAPGKRTITAPASHYRYMYPQPFAFLARYGFSADDTGESDHLGVWARVSAAV